ncbi:DUF4244 domain-containing protein [Ornithinicoccus halotolerans]|uniref:DUF4244 domain-containing protein n=1 Tax=Ornithinicoccus halotolerans TaxID=1748220 RepID=UPI0012965770|nr:DUF4244 domain-containing protein [Ornithinicoccus halotolerans]
MRIRIFVRGLRRQLDARQEAGMSTAEYAVCTLAACAFAAVLLTVVKSNPIMELITSVIRAGLDAVL